MYLREVFFAMLQAKNYLNWPTFHGAIQKSGLIFWDKVYIICVPRKDVWFQVQYLPRCRNLTSTLRLLARVPGAIRCNDNNFMKQRRALPIIKPTGSAYNLQWRHSQNAI